jgi:hypothetical protein
LFNAVEGSGNYVFEDVNPSPPPTAIRTRVVSYALGVCKVFTDSVVIETSKRAHLIGSLEDYCPFLVVESDRRANDHPSPSFPRTLPHALHDHPTPIISQNASNQIF